MKRTMKIMLSALLIVSLLACLVACGGSGKGPSGKYTLVSMESDGMTIEGDTLKSLGMEVTIEFNADGTGTIDFMGESEDFTWKDGKMISDGEELPFTFSGDTVTIEQDGAKMVFEK